MTTIPGAADWRAANRTSWDERVPIHVAGPFYDLPGFIAGEGTLRNVELDEVGDVSGRTLLHLQRHIGLDTLSWTRRGAAVTGVDFSEPAAEAAGDLAVRIGVTTARFVTADVYGAVRGLGRQTFDIVHTGLGALCRLPDIARWARTAAALVAPGDSSTWPSSIPLPTSSPRTAAPSRATASGVTDCRGRTRHVCRPQRTDGRDPDGRVASAALLPERLRDA